MVVEQGQTNVIRICSATVPKTNLDAPDRCRSPARISANTHHRLLR